MSEQHSALGNFDRNHVWKPSQELRYSGSQVLAVFSVTPSRIASSRLSSLSQQNPKCLLWRLYRPIHSPFVSDCSSLVPLSLSLQVNHWSLLGVSGVCKFFFYCNSFKWDTFCCLLCSSQDIFRPHPLSYFLAHSLKLPALTLFNLCSVLPRHNICNCWFLHEVYYAYFIFSFLYHLFSSARIEA